MTAQGITGPAVAIADVSGLQAALNALLSTAAAAATYLTQSNAASTYLTQANAASTYLTSVLAASTYLAKTGGTITGSVVVQDAASPTKNYGLRTSGSNLDFDAAGADLFLSTWSGVSNTGSQRNYLRLESGSQLAHALNRWVFAATAFSGTFALDIDPATGVVAAGAKNSLAGIRFCGKKGTAGAPSTGTWVADDLIIDSAGAWHLCTVGGTPGTWT